jgi:hypothetical protein
MVWLMQKAKSLIITLLLAAGSLAAPAMNLDYQVAVQEGDTAAGTSWQYTFFSYAPMISANGIIAFHGSLHDGVNSRGGVWSGVPGNYYKALLTREDFPGSGGATVGSFLFELNRSAIAPDGGLALTFTATGTGVTSANDSVLVAGYPATSMPVVAREGGIGPGGTQFYTLGGSHRLYMRDGLKIAFASSTGTETYSVWAGTTSALGLSFKAGMQTDQGNTIPSMFYESFGFNPNGDIYHFIPGVPGIYRGQVGQLPVRVHYNGGPSPVAGRNYVTVPLDDPVTWSTGLGLVFRGMISDTPNPNYEALVVSDGTTQRLVAAAGENVLGLGTLREFANPISGDDHQFTTGSDGSIATYIRLNTGGAVTNSNSAVLLYFPPGGDLGDAKVVVRQGDPVPGGGGAIFDVFTYMSYAVNGNGTVAFLTTLAGDDVTDSNDTAMFAWDANYEELRMICREGTPQLFADGVTRTPGDMRFRGGPGSAMGVGNGISDTNEIVFAAGGDPEFIAKVRVTPTPAHPLTIVESGTPGERNLVFPSELGKTYQVRYRDDLGSAWQNYGGAQAGTGANLTVLVGSATPPTRFFQVTSQQTP